MPVRSETFRVIAGGIDGPILDAPHEVTSGRRTVDILSDLSGLAENRAAHLVGLFSRMERWLIFSLCLTGAVSVAALVIAVMTILKIKPV